MNALTATDFNFPGQQSVYHGKVRDVYNINGEKLVMVATDRISAFDVVLPKGIPFKGQMLNQIAAKFLDATTDICPNWKTATPDPMVTVGVMCEGFPVEMIVRGYLCGSAWRAYKSGVREICGVKLPEGMKENQKFPEPIITPTTKAEIGEHDADISKEEILAKGLATPEEYAIRQAQRHYLPDGRNPHTGLQPLFLLRRLRRTLCQRRTAKAAFKGIRARMANGQRFPGQRGTAGSGNDRRNRDFHQRTLHRAVRAHHRREVC